MSEFELISKYFVPLTKGRTEAENLKNDAAVLDVPVGKQLVVTSDTLVADIHFFKNQDPEIIAKKALRSNLSDLNAMGAKPYCYQLCLSMPQKDENWLERFTSALAKDQNTYDIFLSGGDTTSTSGPLTISITAFGLVDQAKAISRLGAKEGDLIYLTGSVGDAYCGLQALRGQMSAVPQSCIDYYYVPEPPMSLNPDIHEYATAALDISDGLIQDLGHIASASTLQAQIGIEKIKYSSAVQTLLDKKHVSIEELLTGGDDYQLLLTIPKHRADDFEAFARSKHIDVQAIGVMKSGTPEVLVIDENAQILKIDTQGWQHF